MITQTYTLSPWLSSPPASACMRLCAFVCICVLLGQRADALGLSPNVSSRCISALQLFSAGKVTCDTWQQAITLQTPTYMMFMEGLVKTNIISVKSQLSFCYRSLISP